MAFLIRYTSGFICTPKITPDHATHLGLHQMVTPNADPKGTAYTITIEQGNPSITTGISAQDRALTCRKLASPNVCLNDLRRPGHIVPLQARPGGIRERQGHTEAAVGFCQLAGKTPVAVIAELVDDRESVDGVPKITQGTGILRRGGYLTFGKTAGDLKYVPLKIWWATWIVCSWSMTDPVQRDDAL
ncbi:DHBP synthase RibB-like alpha/beta domain-containing protein [Aspergillus cavernicola]|uniref:3,4-dihydroxy-2-butanone-4-phosphate synthase n=1 Tax=Aspergillus cavernicola TaxID=176166 RepID=A0ABR4HQ15_9EURO